MPETFSPTTWSDGTGGGTPITAAQLNRIETGVESMDDRVTSLETTFPSSAATNAQTGTSYTPTLSDAGVVIQMTNAAASKVIIPANASVAFPTGTFFDIRRGGTGLVAAVPASGVTLRSPAGSTVRAQYSTIRVHKIATNEWVASGDLVNRYVDPDWTVGINSNSDILAQIPRADDLGAPVMRLEFDYFAPVADLKPAVDLCAKYGIRPQLLAGWNAGLVPDLLNVVTWATAFGPGGSNWPGGSSPYAVLNIELGNENSMSYKSGTYSTQGYIDIAQSYGTRSLAVQTAIASAGSPVKLVLELEDGGSGSANWINNVVATGTTALLDNMAGPAIHSYGPDWATKLNRCVGQLATAGSTKKYYITETGIATDNGTTMTPDNYGYTANLTYNAAATAFGSVLAGMRAHASVRQVLLYQVSDQRSPGQTTQKEHYFGIVQQGGAGKGDLATLARTYFASSYTDAYVF